MRASAVALRASISSRSRFSFSMSAWNATSAAGEQRLGVLKANRILFLGNSLTLHGPREEIGWKHNWGMAASAPERDFVHLVTFKDGRVVKFQEFFDTFAAAEAFRPVE